MASRLTVYSTNQISDLICQISYIICSCGNGTQAIIQTHKLITNQTVQTNRHGPQNIGCNIASADIKHYSPTLAMNEGNVGRRVCPGFWKSTYGSSLAKTSETILETATL